MPRIFRCVKALALVGAIGLSGCGDRQMPMAPDTSPQVLRPFFSQQPAPGFDVLRRTRPLRKDVSSTKAIGVKGGTIKLKGAGFVLEIPKGALKAKTEITVTAAAGDAIAFTFSPHGLPFLKPATIRLHVPGTRAEEALAHLLASNGRIPLPTFKGIYFVGDVSGGVQPLEILETFLEKKQIIFLIGHFSGYAVVGA